MRIGIFSYNKYSLYMNFGAALHSFAFQKLLDKYEIESYIVDYRSKHVENFNFNNLFLNNLKANKINTLKELIASLINTPSLKKKYKKFNLFYENNTKMYSNNGKPFYYSNFIKEKYHDLPFTTVICESDVTWSPITNDGFDQVLFFNLKVFNEMNKVAYSPSISNTNLTKEQEKEFKNLLKNYDYLSSREDQTAKYVSRLTNKECLWVLDPVLLLDEIDYKPYMKKLKFNNYVIVYNCMKNDKNLLKEAQKYAEQHNLTLIEISDYNQNKIKYKHKVLTDLGIEEFLYLFYNADYIFTNGFHGACFAIVFKKNFYLFARDGYDIKIKSLLRMFNLENRYVGFNKNIQNDIKPIDYTIVNEILAIEQKKSIDYILGSIK